MKKLLLSFLPILVAFMLVGSPSVGIAQTTDGDFQNALNQLRTERQAFKDAKADERNQAAEERGATAQARREAAQQKRAEAQQRMETKRKEVLLKLVDIQECGVALYNPFFSRSFILVITVLTFSFNFFATSFTWYLPSFFMALRIFFWVSSIFSISGLPPKTNSFLRSLER